METPRHLQSRILEMADTITFAQQLTEDEGECVLMNVFRVAPEDRAALIKAWRHDALYMQEQPGFVSAQLHVGHAGSNVLFNYAVWRTVEDLRQAVSSPGFIDRVKQYPSSSRPSPHVFRTLAVQDVCAGQVDSLAATRAAVETSA